MYDRGQATPLLAMVVALGGVSALLMTHVGLRAVERAKAQTAADAVVLAVASGDEVAALDVARRNGAVPVDIFVDSEGVEVRVERAEPRRR